MEKSQLECPGCSSTNFHLHEITIADPQSTEDAAASSAFIICTDCHTVVDVSLPPYPPKHLKITVSPVEPYPAKEGAYGEGSC
jgi:uncharacterized Zn finger protein